MRGKGLNETVACIHVFNEGANFVGNFDTSFFLNI